MMATTQNNVRSSDLSSSVKLRLLSFNMHGLNQGSALVESWCVSQSFDILLIQEHWLASSCFSRLHQITPGYQCIMSSAMEQICSTNILRGRPFGGMAVVIGDNFRRCMRTVMCTSRIIAVLVSDILVVNVYLPCQSVKNYKELTLEVIANLEEICNSTNFKSVIIGGDFNCNLELKSWSSEEILNFMNKWNLRNCDCQWPDNSKITFHHDSLQLFSYRLLFSLCRRVH